MDFCFVLRHKIYKSKYDLDTKKNLLGFEYSTPTMKLSVTVDACTKII